MFRAVAAIAVPCFLVAGCAFDRSTEFVQSESAESLGSVQQASTGSNPRIDAEYWGEITPPSGITFTDMAVGSSNIYFARSDGMIGLYSRQILPAFKWNIAAHFQHLEYVETSPWYLIATDDDQRKVYYAAQNQPHAMGLYPGDVTAVSDVAAQAVSDSVLNVWIVYYVQGGARRLRAGQYDRIAGILTWQPTSVDWGYYNKGMTVGLLPDGTSKIFGVHDYTSSYLSWYALNDLSKGKENHFNYTEHAYLHAEGENDKFSGKPLHYYDGYFYCLDDYYNHITGRRAVVMSRLPRTALMP